MNKVSKIKVEEALAKAIQEAVNQLGGWANFIQPNQTILLKPNFNTADPFPASTDFEFLKTIAQLVCQLKPKKVIIGESSTMYLKTSQVIKDLKIAQLEKIDPVIQIYNFDQHPRIKKQIPGAKYLKFVSLPKILDQVDKLILLPCLKTHSQAQFTGALKLSVGFIKPIQRVRLHARHLQEKIGELNKLINPDLIIMDGRKCFINEGPSHGEVKEPNFILASTDRIALDLEAIKIIQSFPNNDLVNLNPPNLPQIQRAREMGL